METGTRARNPETPVSVLQIKWEKTIPLYFFFIICQFQIFFLASHLVQRLEILTADKIAALLGF